MRKLPKAPLQEVIFELRWDLDINPETKQQYDKGYEIAIGVLRSLVKKDFPKYIKIIPFDLPNQFMSYQVLHQYWTKEKKWPLLQLGPGIFTVNDTDQHYEWNKEYFPLIKKSINWLLNAYENNIELAFASLRYIDSVKVNDYKFTSWKDFIKNSLNFNFENKFDSRGNLNKFNFTQVFAIDDNSDLHISISNGKNNKNEDMLFWETNIIRKNHFNEIELLEWIEQTHKTSSDLFKELCKKDFYASFIK